MISGGRAEAGIIYVGSSDEGELTINGGILKSASGIIGRYSGAIGRVTVTGSGSAWTIDYSYLGYLEVGFSGQGTLTIEKGGTVKANG
jgi:T5SS/PEP-CTERM-associated repeat protein